MDFYSNDFRCWDSAIRKNYGVRNNVSGYFTFMILVKRQLKKLGIDAINQVEKSTNRPILKILDGYNWYIGNKEKSEGLRAERILNF